MLTHIRAATMIKTITPIPISFFCVNRLRMLYVYQCSGEALVAGQLVSHLVRQGKKPYIYLPEPSGLTTG